MPDPRKLTTLGVAAVVVTIGAAPFLTNAADHIDASTFGSLGSPGGAFASSSVNGERDINDVAQAEGLADFLLPDVLTYDTATAAGGLNGRARDHDERLGDERRRRPARRLPRYLPVPGRGPLTQPGEGRPTGSSLADSCIEEQPSCHPPVARASRGPACRGRGQPGSSPPRCSWSGEPANPRLRGR